MNTKNMLVGMLGFVGLGIQAALFVAEPPRLGPAEDRFRQQAFEQPGQSLLDEAIGWHSGEAQAARDCYANLSEQGQGALRAFLGTLRLPQAPNSDVID